MALTAWVLRGCRVKPPIGVLGRVPQLLPAQEGCSVVDVVGELRLRHLAQGGPQGLQDCGVAVLQQLHPSLGSRYWYVRC